MLTPLFEKFYQSSPHYRVYIKVSLAQHSPNHFTYHLEIFDQAQQHIMSTIDLQDKGNGRWIDVEFGPCDAADQYGKFIEENLSLPDRN